MKSINIVIILFIFFSEIVFAQMFPNLGGQRAGISTAQSLKIPIGARASAMGEAFVAVADDASALYWNPAGISQYSNNDLIFSHNEWFSEIKSEFVGAVYHLSTSDALGCFVNSLNTDDMEITNETHPFGTGEFFSFGDLVAGLTYSRRMTSQFSFGFTVKYFQESLADLKMDGILVDIGTFYWTGLGSTRFSVVVSNFGSELSPTGEVTKYSGAINKEYQSFSPPTMFKVGFAFEPLDMDDHKLTSSIQLNHPNDNSENLSLGLEYIWGQILFLRAGYKINVDEENVSFGAGVNVPLGFSSVKFDYAFVNFNNLGATHRISLLISF